MKNIRILSLSLILFVAASCGSTKSLNPLKILTENSWMLDTLMGIGINSSDFSGDLPSLNFLDAGKLSGFSGCNTFNGNFSLEGASLKLDPGAMTRKACPGNGEQNFMSALGKVNDLKIGKDKLTLMDGANELMTLIPRK